MPLSSSSAESYLPLRLCSDTSTARPRDRDKHRPLRNKRILVERRAATASRKLSSSAWLGAEANLGAIGATYNLTMDPYEKYDMTFNGAAPYRVLSSSPGKYAGEDNGWVLSLIYPPILAFDKSIMKYPSIKRFPGSASTDLVPNLQHPENPVPLLKDQPEPHIGGGGG